MIDLKKLSEPLCIDQIDFRIQSINKGKYATILAYKDARVDMQRLDEVCTPMGWQRDHKEIKGVVYCGIGIKDEDTNHNFTWKWDAGTESMAEKQKGEASDSFKRAGFNWGIGRELYDYPVISVKLSDNECQEINGKMKQTFNLKLKEWIWFVQFDKDKRVTYLATKDQNNNKRFEYGTYVKQEIRDQKTLELEKAEVDSNEKIAYAKDK